MKTFNSSTELVASAMRRIESASRSDSKCNICAHPLREEIDKMLVVRVKYDSILSFARGHGLQLSPSGLSRHRSNHLLASESEVVDQLEDAETAVRKVLTRLVREMEHRDLKDLSTKQLAAYTQAALEVSVANRSLPPAKRSGEAGE